MTVPVVDTPLRFALGRTPRELLLLSCGAGYCVYEACGSPTSWSNFAMYALATVAFAVRFFPARALGTGVAIGALAQRLPDLRLSWDELRVPHTWVAVGVIVVLASSDLEERFDRAPSRLAWLPNRWADLPARDVRVLRGCVYALGALAALVVSDQIGPFWGWSSWSTVPLAGLAVVAVLTAILALLAAGRAAALLLVPLACAPIALGAALELRSAEAAIRGDAFWLGAHAVGYPQDALPLVALAALATALAAPHAVRLVRRTLLAADAG